MRFIVLVAAVLMQMCLGATYSWSVYVQPLKTLTGLQQAVVQVPFTVFYFVFPLTMMVAGNLLPRIGTRRSAMLGGLCFGGGWLLAGLGTKSFLFTILGIGGLAGIGAGLAYIVPIAVCVQWFPRNKGMVTGVAVAGFGGGAALVSQLGGWLMNSGMTPFTAFMVFGAAFMVIVVGAGSVMQPPRATGERPQIVPLRWMAVLCHPGFRLLYLAMVIGLAAGFAVNANLKELYQGTDDAMRIGIVAVAIFAVANAAGRILWGAVFDRVAAATAIQVNLLFQGATLIFALWAVRSFYGFWLLAFLTGFNYGGVLVIYVSTVTRVWGAEYVGQVYGWLFSANVPASLAPILAGLVYDRTGNFTPVFLFGGFLLAAAAALIRYRSEKINAVPEATLPNIAN